MLFLPNSVYVCNLPTHNVKTKATYIYSYYTTSQIKKVLHVFLTYSLIWPLKCLARVCSISLLLVLTQRHV